MKALRRTLAGALPALLAGAFLGVTGARLLDDGAEGGGRFGALLVGALYGLAVLGLLRLFRVAPWGLVVAGAVAGPVPLALLIPKSLPEEERGGAWLALSFLGLVIGLLELARIQGMRRSLKGAGPPDGA